MIAEAPSVAATTAGRTKMPDPMTLLIVLAPSARTPSARISPVSAISGAAFSSAMPAPDRGIDALDLCSGSNIHPAHQSRYSGAGKQRTVAANPRFTGNVAPINLRDARRHRGHRPEHARILGNRARAAAWIAPGLHQGQHPARDSPACGAD